ncbi:error-prone DNA polymerase [Lichenicola cladoniae]|uniref:Error-prone DNA polymerase n=1 Tax=Lichenicola cladoniae TaxID=1484109 RepID=A0A6M8HVV3_9PROT|nr:error-prone DNA polymerase [Lichenicola cladoniae]NPD66648.1 error-prone DNA polymerase [Acetobacteraceae bacterium]QKE92277.1 error-prone DNA polymerase [Lichenicola cladoniae]
MPDYVELQATSNYSFLRGASHVEELFLAAKELGLEAIAITDHNTLAGIARAHARAEEVGIPLIVGCRLELRDGLPLLVYPTDRAAYSRLCRLLTLGKGRAGKGGFDITWKDLVSLGEGLLLILLPDKADARLESELRRMRENFGDRCYLSLTLRRRPGDAVRLRRLHDLAQAARIPTVVTGDVLFHAPDRRILQDVVTCIREGCTIDEAGFRKERFADRHLKSPVEMWRLFGAYPEALQRTVEIARRCTFSLAELRYQYPDEADVPGETPQRALERAVRDSIPLHYPDGLPGDVAKQLRHELDLIAGLDYASYFLTVNSIVRYARSKEILCQGRGSAANSAVCYVLGITSIDPVRSGLLFERFISAERREPPDIDVDFESERREEVIQWVYQRYGRDRAALCCTVMRFRSRGAVRDVGKVMGLTEDVTAALASQVSSWSRDGVTEEHVAELNLNMADRRLRLTLQLAQELVGFPRQLGTHPGGFVLTQDRLDDLVPIEPAAMADRQVIEWDKDDIDALKFMKVDVLGLGMLGCMRRSFELLQEHHGVTMDVATIPAEDPATYAMIRKADTLGTFQIESRAQMSMLPRLKPVTFYDLVVQVAIVRPGPIQGDMVHPYLRRREGKEPVEYPKEELRRVLGKTLGIPLFQEQAMQVAIQCAGFTPGEADQLRRSMATFKFTGGVSHFKDKLIEGMVGKDYERSYAERTFSQLEGFGSYGFPESHAASFALIAYASSWMKCHHPDVFCTALLNSQPMGFYAPAQVVRDAREHGVEVRPVCVNASRWDCTLEPRRDNGPGMAVRLGLRLAKGLANQDGAQLVANRGDVPYASVEEIWRRADIPAAALERLAEADAFQSLGLDRRQALWQVKGLVDTALPLFAAADIERRPRPELVEPPVVMVPMRDGREVVEDYRSLGLSLRSHPVSFIRPMLQAKRMICCADLRNTRDGRRIIVPGIVLVRQKPGSAKGVMFITIEDETGVANLVLWPDRFEKQRRLVLSAGMIACHGKVQREGEVVHVVTDHLEDLSQLLRSVGDQDDPFPIEHGRGDVVTHPAARDPRDGPGAGPGGRKIRDIYVPDLHIRSGIKVPTRDFR